MLSGSVAQFENQIATASAQRMGELAAEMETRVALERQRADEAVENLGGLLKLVQVTARAQQEKMTKHSRTTVANFEKEMKALLCRLQVAIKTEAT
jgi:hypothetical protein